MRFPPRLLPHELLERAAAVTKKWLYGIWAFCVLAILLLSLPAVWPLLGDDLLLTGDTSHAARIYEMHACLSDGQIPCRWTPDLGNGYGYPLFNYYPPLPYYAGAALHWLGFSYLASVNLLAVAGLVGAALSMFALARRFWGELGGLISAVAYLYSPYLALDVYMRGAIAELWALAILPALFLAVHELIVTSRWRYVPMVAVLGALVLLSHNLVAVIAAPALAIWALVFLVRCARDALRPTLLLAAAAVWGVGLAAFFTLPVLSEGDLVQLDTLAHFPFNYSNNFASLTDLFILRSNDYSALLGVRDGTTLQIGWFHWGIALLALPTGVAAYRSGQRSLAVVIALFLLFFAIGVVMSISASGPVWDLFDSLRFIQFPWRYVGLASFAAAALAGSAFALLRGRSPLWRGLFAAALIALFVLSGWTFFRPYHACDLRDSDVLTKGASPGRDGDDPVCANVGPAWGAAITDYLPEGVQEVPGSPSAPMTVASGAALLNDWDHGSDWLELDVSALQPTVLHASLFDFPNWRVRVDGDTVPHTASDPYGLIEFALPAGRHDVELRLEDTNVRRWGNAISFLSWGALLVGVPAFVVAHRRLAGRRV